MPLGQHAMSSSLPTRLDWNNCQRLFTEICRCWRRRCSAAVHSKQAGHGPPGAPCWALNPIAYTFEVLGTVTFGAYTLGGAADAQVLTSELFGLRHMASNQSVIHLAPTLGNLALATYLAGGLYQRRGRANGDPPGTCYGPDCYRCASLVS